jgi:hypothetical protein
MFTRWVLSVEGLTVYLEDLLDIKLVKMSGRWKVIKRSCLVGYIPTFECIKLAGTTGNRQLGKVQKVSVYPYRQSNQKYKK